MSETAIPAGDRTGTADKTPPLGPFGVGAVISKTFGVYFRNLFPFFILGLLVMSPQFILGMLILSGVITQPPPGTFGTVAIVFLLLTFPLTFILAGALTYGTYQDLRGRKATVGSSLAHGLRLIFPVLGVSIVYSLFIGIGSLFLIIPGMIFMVIYSVAVPVTVVERKGIRDSLSRSDTLTRGFRWKIFGILLIVMAIAYAASLGLGAISGLSIAAIGIPGGMAAAGLVSVVCQWLIQASITPLYSVVLAVTYNDLRVAKEGADVEQIAAVFD